MNEENARTGKTKKKKIAEVLLPQGRSEGSRWLHEKARIERREEERRRRARRGRQARGREKPLRPQA